MECTLSDQLYMLKIGGNNCCHREQWRHMQAAVTVVRMPDGIRVVRRRRVAGVRMMLFVQTGRAAVVRHIHSIEHAFEPRRKQTQNNQH